MKTGNNYKILILSDLKKGTKNTLKSAISLAKMIQGDLQFFHVKSASNIVGRENQLSAMRSINKEYVRTENKIQKMINSITSDYNESIDYSFAFGSVKEEISRYIKEYQPDVIVLGKRKKVPFNIVGDSITQFVLKLHKGAVLIASDNHILEPNQEISLGLLNGTNDHLNVDFASDLMSHAQEPLRSFKIIKNSGELEKNTAPVGKKRIEYVFEQSDSVIKNLSRYLSKNNIKLLCVNRENNYAISKLDVSLLVAN